LVAKVRWALVAMLGLVVALAAPLPAGAAPVPAPMGAPAGPPPIAPAPPGFPVPVALAPGAPVPPPLDWLSAAKTNGLSITAKHGALEQLGAGRAAVVRAGRAVRGARAHLSRVRNETAHARSRIARLERLRAAALGRERERAVRAYIDGEDAVLISDLFSAASINDQASRAIYADAAQGVDAATIDALDAELRRENGIVAALREDEERASHTVDGANSRLDEASKNLLVLTAVADDASHGGRVFPVDGPFELDDSWGAFRADLAVDTHSHGHDATDIMAPLGTPVVAIESGTLDRVGWNALGGWRLWIKGVSGTDYYYAHMSAYAPGLAEGTPVLAGQYLGRVGNTGNAAGGPTHLHLEVHLPDPPATAVVPGKAPAVAVPVPVPAGDGIVVNPYPLLCLLAGAPVPVIPPSDPPVSDVPGGTPTSTVAPDSRGT
jgi:murein DD-endopeptidase MepM/ murein hydrolase activator NlpD